MVPLKGSAPALFSTVASVFQVSCVFLIHRTPCPFPLCFFFLFGLSHRHPERQKPAHTPHTAVCKDPLSTATLFLAVVFQVLQKTSSPDGQSPPVKGSHGPG